MRKKGLRITNSGNSSFLHLFSHEQQWSEHILAQDTNTSYFFITHGWCGCFLKQAQHSWRTGAQELDRSFTTFTWTQAVYGTWGGSALCRHSYQLFSSDIPFAVHQRCDNLACEFAESEELYSEVHTHTALAHHRNPHALPVSTIASTSHYQSNNSPVSVPSLARW